jgi:hypothetical protein
MQLNITLQIVLSDIPEYEDQPVKSTILRKTWELESSPFWVSYIKQKPDTRHISYPILPYPGTEFWDVSLGGNHNLSFTSARMLRRRPSRAFSSSIFCEAVAGSVGISSKELPNESTFAKPDHAQIFLNAGWEEYVPDEED